MKKNYWFLISPLLITAMIFWIFFSAMPRAKQEETVPLTEFSTVRALRHIAAISKEPHYAGSKNHEIVAEYVIGQLRKLGLETSIQEGYAFSSWGSVVKAKNILARIRGGTSFESTDAALAL
jgi:hypothetical protein